MNDDFKDFRRLTYKELVVIIKEEDPFIVGINSLEVELLDIVAIIMRLKAKYNTENIQELL